MNKAGAFKSSSESTYGNFRESLKITFAKGVLVLGSVASLASGCAGGESNDRTQVKEDPFTTEQADEINDNVSEIVVPIATATQGSVTATAEAFPTTNAEPLRDDYPVIPWIIRLEDGTSKEVDMGPFIQEAWERGTTRGGCEMETDDSGEVINSAHDDLFDFLPEEMVGSKEKYRISYCDDVQFPALTPREAPEPVYYDPVDYPAGSTLPVEQLAELVPDIDGPINPLFPYSSTMSALEIEPGPHCYNGLRWADFGEEDLLRNYAENGEVYYVDVDFGSENGKVFVTFYGHIQTYGPNDIWTKSKTGKSAPYNPLYTIPTNSVFSDGRVLNSVNDGTFMGAPVRGRGKAFFVNMVKGSCSELIDEATSLGSETDS